MRITSEILLRLANDFIAQRTRTQRDILAVYLHGSLLGDSPVLGGAADIDLFFIHIDQPKPQREIVRITDDIHLDVAHQGRDIYRHTRDVRMHPWLGPVIYGCKILYDPQHFLDFIQAGVRDQFNRPDNILGRARQQAQRARQTWLDFQLKAPGPGPQGLSEYLQALEAAANAVALLSGPPLTERRFLLQFAERAQAVNHPGLLAGILGLLGGGNLPLEQLHSWLPAWQTAYQGQPVNPGLEHLHPHRLNYYLRALENMLVSGAAFQMALWPLATTWTALALHSAPASAVWQEFAAALGLVGDGLAGRLAALDAYLDTVDETLETWGREKGA